MLGRPSWRRPGVRRCLVGETKIPRASGLRYVSRAKSITRETGREPRRLVSSMRRQGSRLAPQVARSSSARTLDATERSEGREPTPCPASDSAGHSARTRRHATSRGIGRSCDGRRPRVAFFRHNMGSLRPTRRPSNRRPEAPPSRCMRTHRPVSPRRRLPSRESRSRGSSTCQPLRPGGGPRGSRPPDRCSRWCFGSDAWVLAGSLCRNPGERYSSQRRWRLGWMELRPAVGEPVGLEFKARQRAAGHDVDIHADPQQ